MRPLNRRVLAGCLAAATVLALALTACKPASSTTANPGAGGSATATATTTAPAAIRIGTLPTEDTLSLWVAEHTDRFKAAGLDVTITTFASARERDAALTAGAIDGEMSDMVSAALLRQGGFPVKVTTLLLGATPAQGRFGIAVKPGSKVTDLKQLAGVPIGTSSATIQEYVLDSLMKAAGVPDAQVKTQEVAAVPARFQLLTKGSLAAAALPEPFLSLAQLQGAHVVADDTAGANLSQTVLLFSEKYLKDPAHTTSVFKLLGAIDQAAQVINQNPNIWRALLVTNARLPQELAKTYKVNTYPRPQLPRQTDVDPLLAWMRRKGLLKSSVTYADLMWSRMAAAVQAPQ